MDPINGFILGLSILQFIDKKWLRPEESPAQVRAATLGEFNLPRAEEGTPIPLFWGRIRIDGANLIWAGGFRSDPVDGFGGTFEYRITMLFLLGIPGQAGGAGPTLVSSLLKFWIGEKLVWSGVLNNPADTPSAFINRPNLLGGPGQGGGVAGYINYLPGNFSQMMPARVSSRMTNEGEVEETLLSNYRGQSVVCLTGFLQDAEDNSLLLYASTGWLVGENPSLDAYSFEVRSICKIAALGNHGQIGDGDANPANVLWDLLSQKWGKAGLGTDALDTVSFTAAAVKLAAEEHGISLWAAASTSARDLAKLILTQIGGVLWIGTDGKYHLTLIREDYDVGDLPVFDRDNVVTVDEYAVTTWAETINEVKVTFNQRTKGYKDGAAVASDPSLISRYGKNTVEIAYPGCTTMQLARQLASRDLRAMSLPIARCRITVNRDAFEMPPAGLFVLDWSDEWPTHTPTVFRIANVNLGKPGSEQIVLECIQDTFAFDYAPFEWEEWETLPLLDPTPITERHITEAPRWLLLQAENAGMVSSSDFQRLHYLAVPGDNDITYQARRRVGATTVPFVTDSGVIVFPQRAVLDLAYGRENDPYDTTVGLRITDLVGQLGDGNTALGNSLGQGLLLLVGDDPALGEFVAFENVTDLGGGDYLLENVSRGLLDTVPRDWPAGTRVYLLGTGTPTGGLAPIGTTAFRYANTITTALTARAAIGVVAPTEEPHLDEVTIRLRTELSYPPADLELDASKQPDPLEEEGTDITWKKRDRWSDTITRGDAASETVEVGTTYSIVATKGATETVLVEGLTTDSDDDVPLAPAGHGDLDVSVRAIRPVVIPGVGTVSLPAWQDPSIPITAYVWRNLLLNPRFADSTISTHWTTTAGAPARGTTAANALGGGGAYLTASTDANFGVQQVRDITGYFPARLRALLAFYGRNITDAVKTVTVTLVQLDAADATLVTTTYGPTAQSTSLWNRRELDVATLHNDCVKVKVTITATNDSDAGNPVVTECILRVGQFTDNLVATNNGFELGDASSWTATGIWQFPTTTKYEGTYYARPTNIASAALSRTVAAPAGFEIGWAVLECARMNDDVDDTGEVVLECLDAGSNVLASTTTGAEAISPVNVWQRRRLFVELPDLCTQVRIRAVAMRVTGSSLNTCFDDFDLRIHKHLDVSTTNEYRFDEPTAQALPTSATDWTIKFPDVAYPDRGYWAGDDIQGSLGIEPTMEDISPATIEAAPFVGIYNETTGSMVDQAMEWTAAGGIQTDGNVTFGNFRSSDSFTVWVVYKTAHESQVVNPAGLVRRGAGSLDSITRGWSLRLADGALPLARLAGSLNAIEVQNVGDTFTADRAIHYAALVYDATAQELRLVTDHGEAIESTAALGEIRCNDLVRFTIGEDFQGQIARVAVWSQALSTADIQSLWTHAGDPSGAALNQQRAASDGAAAAVVDLASSPPGYLVCRYSASQVPLGFDLELYDVATEQTGYGLATATDRTNRVPANASTNQNLAGSIWAKGSTATVAFNSSAGPEGFKDAVELTGTNATDDRLDLKGITVTAAASQRAVWFARAEVAHTARVHLLDSVLASKGSYDFPVTTSWQRFTYLFTTWDNATADCILSFRASSTGVSGTIQIAGPFFLGENTQVPALIPAGQRSVATAPRIAAAQPLSFNSEGEVLVEGVATGSTMAQATLVSVHNGASAFDERDLYIDGTDSKFDHYNSAGTEDTSMFAAGAVWSDRFVVRGRWCRAGLLDAAGVFAGLVLGNDLAADADYGRVATWTPSATELTVLDIGWSGGLGKFDGLIRRVVLYTRETRLPAGP